MKKWSGWILTFLALTFFAALDLSARGGHGGGGGRGGNRGSGMRSPSMSRARPAGRPMQRPGQRPGGMRPGQRPGGMRPIQRPGGMRPIQRPSRPTRPISRPTTRPINRPQRPIQRQGGNVRPNRPGDRVRPDRFRPNRPGSRNWFNNNFWGHHGWRPPYWNDRRNWWEAASWGALSGWLGYGAVAPYGYGNLYDSGYTYATDGQTVAQPVYVQQDYQDMNDQIDNSLSSVDMQTQDWMPLGVFALQASPNTTADPNMYLQLAVSKGGYMAGTMYNATLDQTYELDGTVDQSSQKVTWKLTDSDASPIIETGLYDLTQQITPVKIYFLDGSSQSWYLVRQDQPADTGSGSSP